MDAAEKRRQIAAFIEAMPDASLDEVLETLAEIREFWDWRAALRVVESAQPVRRVVAVYGGIKPAEMLIIED